jgi:hypothetical protein
MFSNGGVGGSDKSTDYTEGHEVMEKTIKVILITGWSVYKDPDPDQRLTVKLGNDLSLSILVGSHDTQCHNQECSSL